MDSWVDAGKVSRRDAVQLHSASQQSDNTSARHSFMKRKLAPNRPKEKPTSRQQVPPTENHVPRWPLRARRSLGTREREQGVRRGGGRPWDRQRAPGFPKARRALEASRWLQSSFDRWPPRLPKRGPRGAPEGPKTSPRRPRMGTKRRQRASEEAFDTPPSPHEAT